MEELPALYSRPKRAHKVLAVCSASPSLAQLTPTWAREKPSMVRTVSPLGRQGVEFDESTRKPKAIYLKGEVGGFAIHLAVKWNHSTPSKILSQSKSATVASWMAEWARS